MATATPAAESQSRFGDFRKTLAGDAVLIFLITCATYSTVYLFEAGYCHYFRVPLYLIRLEVSTVLFFAATSWLVLWCLLNFAFLYFSFDAFFRRRKNPILRRSLLACGPLLAAGVAIWILTGRIAFLVGALIPAILVTGLLLLARGDPEQTLQKFVETADKTTAYPFGSITRLRELGLLWIVQLFVWIFIWVSGWFAVGETFAQRQTEFLVADVSAPKAVLRIYGDQIICAQFDPVTKRCLNKFVLLKNSSDRLDFELQKIGPLTPVSAVSDKKP